MASSFRSKGSLFSITPGGGVIYGIVAMDDDHKSLAISGGIERHPGSIYNLFEIRVSNRRVRDEVDLTFEQVFQAGEQAEIAIGGVAWDQVGKLNNEIDIAAILAKIAPGGRPNYIEPNNPILCGQSV